MGDRLDIPAKRLNALYDVADEARALMGFRNGGTKTVLSKNALKAIWAALDRLDAVSDGPVAETRVRERVIRTWRDVETEADVATLMAQKRSPDARGRYHCIACGRYCEPPAKAGGDPRCEDHDYACHGMTHAEYRNELAFAEDWGR